MYNLRPVFDFVLERRFIFAEDNSYDPLNDSSGSIGLDGQPIANGTSSGKKVFRKCASRMRIKNKLIA